METTKYLYYPKKRSHTYECPYCDYEISNKLGIKLHMKHSHKVEKFEYKKDFICDLCGETFYNSKDTKRHIKKDH